MQSAHMWICIYRLLYWVDSSFNDRTRNSRDQRKKKQRSDTGEKFFTTIFFISNLFYGICTRITTIYSFQSKWIYVCTITISTTTREKSHNIKRNLTTAKSTCRSIIHTYTRAHAHTHTSSILWWYSYTYVLVLLYMCKCYCFSHSRW